MPVNVSSSSPVVDVVVGLGMILFLLSIFTMEIQEWSSQQYNLRAKFLEQSIQGMLKDPLLVEQFYNHPFIQILCFVDKRGRIRTPSYIPSRTFAIAVFDIFMNVDKSDQGDQLDEITLTKMRTKIQAAKKQNPELAQLLDYIFTGLYQKTASVEDKIYESRANIEIWFNNAMDRLSDWYRGYAQQMVFSVGLILALILNIDPIFITTYLWRDPSVRQVMLQNTPNFEFPQETFATNPEQAMQEFRQQFVGLNFPVGWVMSESGGKAFYDSNCQLFPGRDQSFGIPIIATHLCIAPPQSNNQMNILLKLIGIFISALVARQGAPFCFDILKRLGNLRGTGAHPIEKEVSK